MAKPSYKLIEAITESTIRYYFLSPGKRDIIKAIEYSYAGKLNGKGIYNLGFGDYDISKDEIDDSVNSDNGDAYHVLNTVLNSIPMFLVNYPDAVVLVRGSDSSEDFVNLCKQTCKKLCNIGGICKNKNRRINVYLNYVNANFNNLTTMYNFYGGTQDHNNETEIEPYVIGKKYESVFLNKK